jgi:acyl carrier protein
MSKLPSIDPRAWREELGLEEEGDLHSHQFLRFINRLCEALDVDIPASDWPKLTSLSGCLDYLRTHHAAHFVRTGAAA